MIVPDAGQTAQSSLQILTDFGDTAVLLPLSIVFFIWLLSTHRVATAIGWALTLIACNLAIGAMKLYFQSCPAAAAMHSPSGHTGFAIYVYGSLTAVLALQVGRGGLRGAIVALGALFVIAIALSRLMLAYHSLPEVAVGAAVGVAGLTVFLHIYHPARGKRGGLLFLALAALVVALIFHGRQFKTEDYLHSLGVRLGLHAQYCGQSRFDG